jgi:hypothetical protein
MLLDVVAVSFTLSEPMKSSFKLAVLAVLSTSVAISHAEVRAWRDVSNRSWQGEFVRMQGGSAVFSVNGKEYAFPFAQLSAEDKVVIQGLVKPSVAPVPSSPAPAPAGKKDAGFGGAPWVAGQTMEVELPMSDPKWEKEQEKMYGKPSKIIKVAVAVPVGFDAGKPQRVLITNASSTGDGLSIPNMKSFVKAANDRGWLVLAADGEFGKPKGDNPPFRNNLVGRALAEVMVRFPNAKKDWKVATAGFSGGGGYAASMGLQLLDDGWNVSGMLLMNTAYSPLNFEQYIKVSKTKSHKVPIFVSAGEKDNTQKLDAVKLAFGAVEKSGYKTTRLETHPGGHSPSPEHMTMALEWFEKN